MVPVVAIATLLPLVDLALEGKEATLEDRGVTVVLEDREVMVVLEVTIAPTEEGIRVTAAKGTSTPTRLNTQKTQNHQEQITSPSTPYISFPY